MPTSAFIIPADRLPAGFAERIDSPPDPPVEARPAASAILLRDSARGPEVLLMRRHRASGFVPGAYVFPGGTVDAGDRADSVRARVRGQGDEPELGFWVASARELFEEAGVLLAVGRDGEPVRDDARVGWRNALLADEYGLGDLLEREDVVLDFSRTAYFAHWITPVAEPRRYDTHFFLVALPDGVEANADAREMTDARWIPPVDALAEFSEGELPMVFPTVRMLESLVGAARVDDALATARARRVTAVLPRLVRTEHGVGIVVDRELRP
jgi:8-oxo-dGTP pyrophosphatase MutT (NUDIX family)